MTDDPTYEVRTMQQFGGRWVFRLVEVGVGDPSAWESDGKSYLTQLDAERAGRLAVAVKELRSRR
jgi:hypothetical protein